MLDPTTLAAYRAAQTPEARAQAVRDSLGSGTLTVELREGASLVYSGTFSGPMTAGADGSLSASAQLAGLVTTAGTPNAATWTCRITNGSGRYVEGSFGPGGRFTWSQGTLRVGDVVRLDVSIAASGGQDVSEYVWTPSKDVAGNILSASWANLPLNTWCQVAGTKLTQISSILTGMGIDPVAYDFGTSNGEIAPTINAYCGCAFDAAGGKVWFPRGGGHADSSLNGVWSLNLEKMGGDAGFAVERAPSNPDDPTYPWSADYKAGASGSYTKYTPYSYTTEDAGDILPDGTPTSAHTYGLLWYDPVRGKIGTGRNSRWQYNIGTGIWDARALWPTIGGSIRPTIYGMAQWDHIRDRAILWSEFVSGSAKWWTYDDADQSISVLTSPSMPGMQNASYASTKRGDDIWVVSGGTTGERYAKLDLTTLSWPDAGAVGGPDAVAHPSYLWELSAFCHVPDWDKALHIFSYSAIEGRRWRTFDYATKEMVNFVPTGKPPFSVSYRWVGNRVFYYPARKVVVAVDASAADTVNSIYVMRTG